VNPAEASVWKEKGRGLVVLKTVDAQDRQGMERILVKMDVALCSA
jgi:hypothetical protein